MPKALWLLTRSTDAEAGQLRQEHIRSRREKSTSERICSWIRYKVSGIRFSGIRYKVLGIRYSGTQVMKAFSFSCIRYKASNQQFMKAFHVWGIRYPIKEGNMKAYVKVYGIETRVMKEMKWNKMTLNKINQRWNLIYKKWNDPISSPWRDDHQESAGHHWTAEWE